MNPASENPRVLVLAALVWVACGGGLSQEAYRESYGEALCHRQARCGEIRDEDACVRNAREFSRAYREGGLPVYPQYEGSIRAGRLRFDGDEAQECVQYLRDLSCDERLPPAPNGTICDVLEGQQEDGEPCLLTEECGGFSYCERTHEAVCVAGTCRPRPGHSQPVSGSQECAPGLVRVRGTCQPLSGEGGGCDSDLGCTAGLYCEWSLGECRRFAVEGAPCSDGGARCLPHLSCSEGRCQRLSDVGADCTPPQVGPEGFKDTECKKDLFCDGGGGTRLGTCRERLGPGERCFDDTCGSNLFCSTMGETQQRSCQAFRQLGESCEGVPCAPGAWCDPDSEMCRPQGRLGEPCVSSQLFSCISGLSCQNNRCEPDFGGLCE
jgi:hypothetical protein